MADKPRRSDGKKRSRENSWDFLNKPIGFNSIIELLNKEIEIGKKKSDVAILPNLDRQAEDLITRAENLARANKISLEEALQNFGIDLDAEEEDTSGGDTSGMRDNMLKSLDWKVETVEDSPAAADAQSNWVRRATDALNEIQTYLGVPDSEPILAALEQALPTDKVLRDRLTFLEVCSDEDFQGAEQRFRQGRGPFWHMLVESPQRDIELFAEVLATMSYTPIARPEQPVFCEWLLDRGYLNYRTFKEARALAKKERSSVCRLLAREDFLGIKHYLETLSEYTEIPVWTAAIPRPTPKLLRSVKRGWVEHFELAPVRVQRDKLDILVSSPLSPVMLEKIAATGDFKINQHLIASEELLKIRTGLLEKMVEKEEVERPVSVKTAPSGRIRTIIESASAVNMVRQLFEGALESRATDIHIDPMRDGARVRFRIDGLCYDVMQMDSELLNEVASRIKILADLDITEKRRPQDGHIKIGIRGEEYDMRIATVPTKFGEKAGIRLVYAGRSMKPMAELGLHKDDYKKTQRFISMPHGMILATGPVGSGKTTSLYSCLNEIDRDSNNVMSIEDPVELTLPGANQVEANYKLQFGFAEGLRALLRQDPDTILVGEIRDDETARIAIRASMTGLLVFSTLHTNDAPGAITALYNFKLPTHLIANSLVGIIAQRLLRRICPHCKTTYKPKQVDLRSVGFTAAEAKTITKLHVGKGCKKCFQTGYFDRVGVFEVMEVTPKLRDMVLDKASEKQLREMAIKEGMRTLAMDGREKILAGETTIEEFNRVIRIS